ncbi:alpha/beta hydrolase [Croceibacterium salegens]|uniref:alpha/beta hydrolase n=1 Tax=Croceibacterium salegens TaxID=1737568 RepID=UPI000A3FE8FC
MDFDRRAIPPAARESKWQTPDGYVLRRIDWPAPAKARGSILFMPGRGDAYEKYLETLDHWNRQGWAVTAADWRGQAGSGRLGSDPVTGHIDDFATWTTDLAALWREWSRENAGPHVLAGHSMGGHLVLRAVAEGAVAPDALVLSAPMVGFLPNFLPTRLKLALADLMCRLGDPRRPGWKWSEKPGELPTGRALLLTHDTERYADESWWRAARPELVMGPGSWGWVRAALRSILYLQRPGVIEAVRTPTLLIAAEHDRLVSYPAIRRIAARLPHGKLVSFGPEAYHELLREADPVRDRAVAAIDAFLDTVSPT